MCTTIAGITGAISAIGSIAATTYETTNKIKADKENYKYQVQIAQANAKKAENEAYKNIQEGIEQSRLEKIKGLEEKKKKISQLSASGFDINSETNMYSFEDSINTSKSNAEKIQNTYNSKAIDYIDKANNYINSTKSNAYSYNNKILQTSRNFLSETGKVAQDWYDSFNLETF